MPGVFSKSGSSVIFKPASISLMMVFRVEKSLLLKAAAKEGKISLGCSTCHKARTMRGGHEDHLLKSSNCWHTQTSR